MSGFDMSQYMDVFLEEAEEQLQILDEGLVMLEQDRNNQELLNKIFRAAHTLKGSSASMGFSKIASLTHNMESVLDCFRNGELEVSQEVIDVLLKCMDALGELKRDLLEDQDTLDVAPLIERLTALQESHRSKKETKEEKVCSSGPGEDITGEAAAAKEEPHTEEALSHEVLLNDTERSVGAVAIRDGYKVYHIVVELDKECVMKSVRAFIVFNNIKDLGDVIRTVPSTEDIEEEKFDQSFELIFISKESQEKLKNIIKSVFEVRNVHIRSLDIEPAPPAPQTEEAADSGKGQSAEKKAADGKEGDKHHDKVGKRTVNQTVRVDVERLDKLMNLVGELVIERTRLEAVNEKISDVVGADFITDSMEEISLHIARLSGDLQEEIMQARMFPIDQVFNRFPRMIRDLSHKFNKEINFIIEGRETELDRTVIEEIGDPLIHLLRNSVDHGIESPEERKRLGKPAKGTIRLTASHQENQIVITVEDDGKGMDPRVLRKKGVEKGLISQQAAEKMSDQEALNLIFMPGFSTARKVSDISGRGVGMDIVRTHVDKINGIIEIDSQVGVGTRFTIKLPLTLAISRSLLIKQAGGVFALPLGSVIEIIEIDCGQIQSMQGNKVVLVRNSFLPLFALEQLLGETAELPSEGRVPVIIVGIQEKRIGIVVDELLGEQEIVIKSLGGYIGDIHGLAGATIMGDGSVALILDVRGLVNCAGVE